MLDVSENVAGKDVTIVPLFPGGTGIPTDPYWIVNVSDLQNIITDRTAHYILMNDVDASITSTWPGGFDPIGEPGLEFQGSFDGQNFTISDLYINRPGTQHNALFGQVDDNVPIKNVVLTNVDISGLSYAAGIVGYNEGNVQNCHVTGTISSTWWVGGIVGDNDPPGIVQDCTFVGDVTGTDDYVGGIIGRNDETIVNCSAEGSVSGAGSVGGLAGFSGGTFGSASDSRANSEVVGTDDYVGGLIGRATRPITNCVAVGNVTGSAIWIGGLAGSSTNTVTDSYTYVNVSAVGAGFPQQVGGLIGSNSGVVTDCTAAGIVNNSVGDYTGGLFGANHAAVSNCTSSSDVIGVDQVGGFAGWNSGGPIDNCSFTGTVDAENQAGGFIGHHDDPSEIVDCFVTAELNLRNVVGGLIGWAEAGSGDIRNCYFIGNLTSSSGWVGGLVGQAYSGHSIDNCFAMGNVTSSSGRTGGLIGANQGFVNESYFSGYVRAYNNVGGLIGQNFGTVNRSYATGTVEGTNSPADTICGGFAGQNAGNGNITNCYSTANVVSAGPCAGGFIAWNIATVNWSYSTGLVTSGGGDTGAFIGRSVGGIVDNILWDNETSGQPVGIGDIPDPPEVVGKNTTDLMQQATYASWDFGSKWIIWEGETRPFLQMEHDTMIANSHQLQLMLMDLTADYSLLTDVDMDVLDAAQMWGTDATQGNGFLPVGNSTQKFTGSLNGHGFEISDLYIDRGAVTEAGLFGWVNSASSIDEVILNDVNITGFLNTGVLIGYCENGDVTDCHASGTVSGLSYVGGLVAWCGDNTISLSSSSCSVSSTSTHAGGLLAYINGGTVENSSASGDVTNTDIYTAGLIGHNVGTVNNCQSYGNVTSTSGTNGGFIGYNNGPVTSCDSYGKLVNAGGDYSGGFIGWNVGTVANCNSWGETNCTSPRIGGFVGFGGGGSISHCTSNGLVFTTQGESGGFAGRGGIAPYDNCTSNSRVIANGWYVGGFAGYSAASSYDNCSVYGFTWTNGQEVGGFTGQIIGAASFKNCNVYNGTRGGSETGGFAGTMSAGMIENCHVYCNVTGNQNVGGFIGEMTGGTVANSTSRANVTGTSNYIGGLIGRNLGQVTGCIATSNTTGGGNYVGGLIGENAGAAVTNSTASGNVTNPGTVQYIGGLIGRNDAGSVSNCNSSGVVNAPNCDWVGGSIGQATAGSTISNCQVTGDTTGDEYVGGFVGGNMGGDIDNCTVACWANATGADLGGFVGINSNDGTIVDSHSSCNVVGTANIATGGFVGGNNAKIDRCTASGNVSGMTDVGGFVGNNMNVAGGYIWNSSSSGAVDGANEVGGFAGTNTYWIYNGSAEGTVSGIGSNVGGFIGHNNAVTAIVTYCSSTGDADAVGNLGSFVGWNQAGYINESYATGDAIGTGDDVGGFVGLNAAGTISECFSSGNAIGDSYVGGFVGMSYFTIVDCYSTGNADGTDQIGGFIGYNNGGTVNNSYCIGIATGTTDEGGFVGLNSATSETNNCFWDTDTSGTISSDGGTGMTTKEMMSQSTFDPPWDFTDIWGIHEANSYPYLQYLGALNGFMVNLTVTIETAPAIVNTYETFYMWLNVTNNGPDNAANVNVTVFDLTVGIDNIDHNMTTAWVWGNNGTWDVGNLFAGESAVAQLNMTVDNASTGQLFNYLANVTCDNIETYWPDNEDTAQLRVNSPPVAQDDLNATDEDTVLNVPAPGLFANDTDPDAAYGDFVALDSYENVSLYGATVVVNANGSFSYDPTGAATLQALAVGESLVDGFNYTIADAFGNTSTAMVSITVNGVNDVPIITGTDLTQIVAESDFWNDYNVTDPDASDTMSWAIGFGPTWLNIDSNGNLTGSPTNADVGTHVINISVSDGNNGTDWRDLTLEVLRDTDEDGIPDIIDDDDDNDGTPDINDDFPLDEEEDTDTDGDGIGDNADDDDDNDGVPDDQDDFPTDPDETTDTDGDGTGDNADDDDDNDDVPDDEDDFPTDPNEDTDSDGDGIGDNADPDDDNDWIPDVNDTFPYDPTEDTDTDNDTIGDNADLDDDGDGVPDLEDLFPFNATESSDNDGDGIGDNADLDDDNDGIPDLEDDDPLNPPPEPSGGLPTYMWVVIVLVAVGLGGALGFYWMGRSAEQVTRPEDEPEIGDETEIAETADDTESTVQPEPEAKPEAEPEAETNSEVEAEPEEDIEDMEL